MLDRSGDTTDHMGYEEVVAHLQEDHPHIIGNASAAILRGIHDSDHRYAGEATHELDFGR